MKIFRISSLSIWPFYSASGRLFSIWPFEHLAVLFSISTRESGIWSFYSASGRFIQHLDTRIWHLVVLFSIWSFYSASGQKNLASGRFIQHLVVLFSIWTKEFGIWPFYSASRCQKLRIWHLVVCRPPACFGRRRCLCCCLIPFPCSLRSLSLSLSLLFLFSQLFLAAYAVSVLFPFPVVSCRSTHSSCRDLSTFRSSKPFSGRLRKRIHGRTHEKSSKSSKK